MGRYARNTFDEFLDGLSGFMFLFSIVELIILLIMYLYKKDVLFTYVLPACFVITLVLLFFELKNLSSHKDKISLLNQEIYKTNKSCERQIAQLTKEKDQVISLLRISNNSLTNLLKSKTPFKDVAEMKADFVTCIYEKDEHYLRYKPHPAKSSADKIKEIRTIFNENVVETKQMYYKYEFLMSVFPELKTYLEDEQSLIHLGANASFDSFEENRDRVLDWLSKEEYNRLSVSDRNQLALDRYKNRNKSNWEIGAEYELYIGYLLRIGTLIFGHEFEVDQYGVKERLNDLGRDIIAEEKDDFGNVTVYIIQCKRWAKDKLLHENVVCQLFGTALEYKLCHDKSIKVVPLLVTTAQLSVVAKQFAQRLGVKVLVEEMGEYPMIKCNIDSMIYHLPFDQQYYTTKVKESKGEFYAWSVKEAENKGYRRAMKFFGI